MVIGTIVGMVSATTRPPTSRARCDDRQLAADATRVPRVDDEHVPVERSVGPPDIAAGSSSSASLKPSLPAVKMPASVVPG